MGNLLGLLCPLLWLLEACGSGGGLTLRKHSVQIGCAQQIVAFKSAGCSVPVQQIGHTELPSFAPVASGARRLWAILRCTLGHLIKNDSAACALEKEEWMSICVQFAFVCLLSVLFDFQEASV